MQGSLRQRSIGSWELRVFIGVDPTTKRRRYRSTTVRSSRADAERSLAAMVAAAEAEREVGVRSTVSELLEAWFAIAVTVLRTDHDPADPLGPRAPPPHTAGRCAVGDVTPAMIDSTFAVLRRGGGSMDGRSHRNAGPGTCRAARRFSQAMSWGWIWTTPLSGPTASSASVASCNHRHRPNSRSFRLHDLRHFVDTEMLHAGVPLVICLPTPRPPPSLDNPGPERPRCARRRRPGGGHPLADHAIKRLMPPASKSSGRVVTTLYLDTRGGPQPSQPPTAGYGRPR